VFATAAAFDAGAFLRRATIATSLDALHRDEELDAFLQSLEDVLEAL